MAARKVGDVSLGGNHPDHEGRLVGGWRRWRNKEAKRHQEAQLRRQACLSLVCKKWLSSSGWPPEKVVRSQSGNRGALGSYLLRRRAVQGALGIPGHRLPARLLGPPSDKTRRGLCTPASGCLSTRLLKVLLLLTFDPTTCLACGKSFQSCPRLG